MEKKKSFRVCERGLNTTRVWKSPVSAAALSQRDLNHDIALQIMAQDRIAEGFERSFNDSTPVDHPPAR